MKAKEFRAIVAVLALVIAGQPEPARAEEGSTTSASTTVYGQTTSDPQESSKFQEYRDLPNGFFVGNLDFNWRDAGWFFDLSGIDLLQNDQRLTTAFGQRGKLRVRLGYDENPKWFSNTAETLYDREDGLFVLPLPLRLGHEGFMASPQFPTLGDMVAANLDAAQDFPDLRYRRDTTTADVRWTPDDHWTLGAGYSHEERAGRHPLTLGTYFSAGDITEIPATTDYLTQNASLSVEYARPLFNLGAQVGMSQFSNDVEARLAPDRVIPDVLVLDNPLRAADALAGLNAAAAQFLIARPPDNESLWLHLNGGVKVGSWARLSGQLSMGQNKQDQHLPPFSLHSDPSLRTTMIPDPGDPLSSITVPVEVRRGDLYGPAVSGYDGGGRFDGDVDLFSHDLRFTGRPIRWFDFKLFSHSYEYDNKTGEYFVTDYVRADTGLEGISRAALPFAWKKDNLGVDLRFKPLRRLGLTAGYEEESWEREFRNTQDSTEDIYRLGLDWNVAAWGSIRASYQNGDRTFDDYDEETFFGEESFPEGEPVANAIVLEQRLFDLANREQDRYDLMAQFTPHERFGFGITLVSIENHYDDTSEVEVGGVPETRDTLGRLEDKTRGWGLDFTIDAGPRVTVNADYGQETFEYELASRYRPVTAGAAVDDPLNNWFSSIEDTTDSYGLGVNARIVPDRWTLDLRGLVADSTGKTRATGVAGGSPTGDPVDFPDVTYDLTSLNLEVRRAVRKNMAVGIGYVWEKYEVEDFARDVMQPWMGAVDPGASESVFLGMRIPDYDVNLFRVLFHYTF